MKKINEKLLSETSSKAAESKRKRINHNFHLASGDLLQRMLNALETDTYVQPHKHENPDKTEVFILLKGNAVVIEFDDHGNVTDHIILDSGNGNFGCEIAPRTWHVIYALKNGTVVYELKNGPYNPLDDKNFAPWAPAEQDENCFQYRNELLEKLGLG